MDELRARNAGGVRPVAHRQFVAEAAGRRLPHAGHAQVLAQHGGHLDVEIVERDDAVQAFGARQVGGTLADVVVRHAAPDVVKRVDRVARPVRPAQLFVGQQQDAAALTPALAQELVPFAVGRNAEQRQRHVDLPAAPTAPRTTSSDA